MMDEAMTGAADLTARSQVDVLLGHAGWIRALARTLARDEHAADDLVQQTWLRALERTGASAPRGPAWLATVVRNLARDAGRRDRRRAAREGASARPEGAAATDDLVARAEAQRRLLREVLALPETWRSVVLLRFYEGLPPREIARRTGVTSATVRTRLHRALAELRRALGPDLRLVAVPLCGAAEFGAPPGLGAPDLIGGIVVTSKKKVALGLLLALLAGGSALWALDDAPKPPPEPAPDTAAAPDTKPAPRERARSEDAPAAPAADTPVAPPSPDVASAPTAPARKRLAVEVLRVLPPTEPPPGIPEMDPDAKAPIAVVEGAGGIELDGDAGMGIVGWSRWQPVPPKGTVTWRGRIVDADGAPVAGADILRVELDASGARASPCSYEWIAGATKSGPDGRFEAKEQPEGAFLLAADFHSRMNGPRGLDLAPAVRVSGALGETLSDLEVRLPFSVARLATVRGVVLDDEGKPFKSASVSSGLQGEWTDAKGRFELAGLDAGAVVVKVDGQGYAERRERLELRPGETRDVEIRLELAEKGSLDLEGRVVDDGGAPVAGMGVYLVATRTGSRWATTDASGTFRFRKLPDAWAAKKLQVVASPMPDEDHYLGGSVDVERVPSPGLEIRIQRTSPVTFLFRSQGATPGPAAGSPIAFFNLTLKRETTTEEGTELRVFRAGTHHDEQGATTMDVPVGRVVIEVEGKGHRSLEVAVVVPAGSDAVDVLLELPPE